MSTSPHTCKGRKRIAVKPTLLALAIAGFLSGQIVEAGDNNPFDGYSAYANSYFLDYVNGTSFAPGGTSDVQVSVTIDGTSHSFNVDTGSRGLYASSTELGPHFADPQNLPGAYPGQIQLTSSHRYNSGYWVPTTLSFAVKDQNGVSKTVTSSVNILDVTTLSAQAGYTATYGVNTSVAGYNGTVNLDGGGTVHVTSNPDPTGPAHIVSLSNSQQISYANNIPGLIIPASNFGIGFDLGGAPGGTGPVDNNRNQIYNALINLDEMKAGTLVAGYIVKSNGIQLGLTASDTNYGYTTLNPTGLTSNNSQPDWQTPMGQTVVNDGNSTTTNGPGSIVMDSGIPQAYISAPGLTTISGMSVYLMNSGGAVGYNIDLTDASNALNPSAIDISAPGTNGTYSQTQGPYQPYFFNTGRNVFAAFDMLYDAGNGFMGVQPNSYGATLVGNGTVVFNPQAGGFPNPIPEASPAGMVLMGLLLLLPRLRLGRFF
ncbi:MAG: hypothetical protein WCH98_03530 [Verrucomicrobiota bacterium]